MFKALTRSITILCTLSLPILQLPTTCARDEAPLIDTIQHLDKLPEEMQLEVLLKLMLPVKQYLCNEILKVPKKRTFKELRGHHNQISSIFISPDGTKLVSVSSDETIKMWDVLTGKLLQTFTEHQKNFIAASLSRDVTKIASRSDDRTIKIWDVLTGKLLQTLPGDPGNSFCCSPDGTKLASASDDHTIKIWDVLTGKLLQTLPEDRRYVNSFSFSSDGTKLVSGSNDRIIKIWDVLTSKLLQTLPGPPHQIHPFCFSADGTKLALASDDHTIKIWDVLTGSVLQTLPWHRSCVNSVWFSPDGTKLASASGDKIIRIWNLYDQQDLELLNEIKRLGPGQMLFLYVLYWNQKGLKSNEGVDLTKTEKTLKGKYENQCQKPPLLLNLKDRYNQLSPELQQLVKVAFHVID